MYQAIIVDDEKMIRQGLSKIIDYKSYNVDIVGLYASAEEAIAYLEDNVVDLIITDICMDVLTGLDLVEHARLKYPDVRCIILSGYQEFDYVKRGLALGIDNYLLKPINKVELEQTIESCINKIERSNDHIRNINLLHDHVMERFFHNKIGLEEFNNRITFLDIAITDHETRLVLIKYSTIISEKIQQKVRSYLLRNDLGLFSFNEDGSLYIAIASDKITIIKEIVKMMELSDYRIYLGKLSSSIYKLYQSYYSLKNLKVYSVFKTNKTTYDYYEYESLLESYEVNKNNEIDTIKIALLSKNKDKIKEEINHYYNCNGLTNHNPHFLYNSAYLLIIEIYQVFNQLHQYSFQNYLDQLNSIDSKDDIVALLFEIIEYVFDDTRKSCYSQLVQEVIEYVTTNYHTMLSLKTISAELFVNTAYLGQLFLKEVGLSFNEYLNNYRLRIAQELLSSTTISVNEIALQVGFQDVGYFSRKFKASLNETPKCFRDKLRK